MAHISKGPEAVPGSNPQFEAIYNPSGFTGQVTSDFMRLGGIPEALRKDLIDFSTSDFDDFKTSFSNYLKAVYPDNYNNFIESDLGIMLVELVAYLGGVLSYKADAIAQENYLATAKTSESVTKLLELIGVSLRGPVSAKANAVAAVTDASRAIATGQEITIDAGNRVIQGVSTRDNLPLTYTLYSVESNGNINMQEDSMVLTFEDSKPTGDAAPADYDGSTFENLVLLEGSFQTQTGTFSHIDPAEEISITLPSVIEGSVVVSAGDGFYTEIDNIWFASAEAFVFEKIYNEDFSCRLKFGRGAVGKTPTPNQDYVIMFRTGGGLRGNVTSGKLSKASTGVRSVSPTDVTLDVTNPRAGTGGVDAQSIEEARRFGPMWFATQYRAVTGHDYTTFAHKFISTAGKTGKALATLRDNGSAGNMIDIYVLQQATADHLERASFEFKKELLEYLNKYRMLTDEITVVDGIVRTLDMKCTLYVDKVQKLSADNIKQRVANNIYSFFSTNLMDFGMPLNLSKLQNFLLKDAGVRFLSIDNYENDIYVDFNEILQLNNVDLTIKFV